MQTAYIALGKAGDILSALAIAQQQQRETIHLVTSVQYAGVANGVPGVQAHIYDGSWDDLAGAIKWAKKKFKKVLVPQTFGLKFPIQHTRPSFQLDSLKRCGLDDWSSVRLSTTRKRSELADKLLPAGRRILLADHSESSGFKSKDDLHDALVKHFGSTHSVVRLSGIKLENPCDFLSLYDAADVLVTIDTMHMHLSSATATPVVALATDEPNRWRGSAWHPRFAFYCRYSDYQSRKGQLIHAVDQAIQKKTPPAVTFTPTTLKNAYNPSIINFEGKLVRAYRFHPNVDLWPTSLAINDKPIKIPPALQSSSLDDPRLFSFKGKLYVSYVTTPYPVPTQPAPCAMGFGELVNHGESWELLNHIQVKYGKNNLTGQEKNWVFFEHNGKLHAIYSCYPDHVVIQVDGVNVVQEHRTKPPACSFGPMRGGTQPLAYKGQWLRFFHTLVKQKKEDNWWHYHVGALVMEPEPPFRILRVSQHPILSGHEMFFPDWKFWKPNVLIPYGAVEAHEGWRVSVGVNDSACGEVLIKESDLNL